MRVFKRITSIFLLILLILQTTLTPAYADWVASGGGNGNAGAIGSGGWKVAQATLFFYCVRQGNRHSTE